MLYDSQTGMWAADWSPTTPTDNFASSPYIPPDVECQWGAPNDVPLGGLGQNPSLSGTTRGQFAVFRPGESVGSGTLYRRDATTASPTTCGPALAARSTGVTPSRRVPVAVPDMLGDGLPEVLLYDSDTGVVTIWNSATDYQTSTTATFPATVGASVLL